MSDQPFGLPFFLMQVADKHWCWSILFKECSGLHTKDKLPSQREALFHRSKIGFLLSALWVSPLILLFLNYFYFVFSFVFVKGWAQGVSHLQDKCFTAEPHPRQCSSSMNSQVPPPLSTPLRIKPLGHGLFSFHLLLLMVIVEGHLTRWRGPKLGSDTTLTNWDVNKTFTLTSSTENKCRGSQNCSPFLFLPNLWDLVA